MGRELTGNDFSDDELTRFFDAVSRLSWSTVGPVPRWVEDEADSFAHSPPKATAAEMRQHIDHAVAVARGWDDPDDPKAMLHAAIKSFYLIHWLEHLLKQAPKRTDVALGYRVSFTPNVSLADPD